MVTPARPTLQAVAEHAGVTAATVSMALRGSPRISRATSARVRRAADLVGYRPDPTLAKLMSHLRQGRSRPLATLGLITVNEIATAWRLNPHLRRYHDAACQRAEELGFHLEEFWLGAPGLTPRRMKDILVARGIEGLFVFSGRAWTRLPDFDFSPFACATYGRWNGVQGRMDRAGANYYLDLLRVVDELRRLGYQRPGLALEADLDERTGGLYSAAFLVAERQGATQSTAPILRVPNIDRPTFCTWYREHRPDVIIAHSPSAAEYLGWLDALGIRVPDDVGFTCLDLDPDDPLNPSGIRQDSERIGSAVVDMIGAKLQRGERGLPERPRILLFEGRWSAGATTRPQR